MLAQRSDMEKGATMWVLPLKVCSLKLVTPTPAKYNGQSSVHILLQPGTFSVLIPPFREVLSFLASRTLPLPYLQLCFLIAPACQL